MKVKIGNKIHDAESEPIVIILNQSDKDNIANMHPDKFKYICFPNGMDQDEIRKFIDEPVSNSGDFRDDDNMESQKDYYGK